MIDIFPTSNEMKEDSLSFEFKTRGYPTNNTEAAINEEFQRLSRLHEDNMQEYFAYYNEYTRKHGYDSTDDKLFELNEKQSQSYKTLSEFRQKYYTGWGEKEIADEDLLKMNPSTHKDYTNLFLMQAKTDIKISMEVNNTTIGAVLSSGDVLQLCNSRMFPFAELTNSLLDEHVKTIVPEEKLFEFTVANKEIR